MYMYLLYVVGFFFRIDSEHNKTVLNAITKEIGTEKYTAKQIKGMLPLSYTSI